MREGGREGGRKGGREGGREVGKKAIIFLALRISLESLVSLYYKTSNSVWICRFVFNKGKEVKCC